MASIRLSVAIENADEERGDAWYVRDTGKGLRLMTGRLLAGEVSRSKMRVSIIGPVADGKRVILDHDLKREHDLPYFDG